MLCAATKGAVRPPRGGPRVETTTPYSTSLGVRSDAGFWLRVDTKLIEHELFALLKAGSIGLAAYLNALGHLPQTRHSHPCKPNSMR